MFFLDFLAWLFFAADEDGTLPVMLGAAIEAGLAVLAAVTIHKLTDIRDMAKRVDRLEDEHARSIIAFGQMDARVEALEEEAE